MFTTSCFIRKNTFAIRAKLSKLGYENSTDNVVGDAIATAQITSHYTTISQKMYDDSNPHSTWSNNRIDCGDNEELFLAIAALRDDKPDYQWFVWDDENDKGDKFKQYIPEEPWQDWWWFEVHKATVKELIEHFK
jgi:hypothetical protein